MLSLIPCPELQALLILISSMYNESCSSVDIQRWRVQFSQAARQWRVLFFMKKMLKSCQYKCAVSWDQPVMSRMRSVVWIDHPRACCGRFIRTVIHWLRTYRLCVDLHGRSVEMSFLSRHLWWFFTRRAENGGLIAQAFSAAGGLNFKIEQIHYLISCNWQFSNRFPLHLHT
jgi:hypothetical protein